MREFVKFDIVFKLKIVLTVVMYEKEIEQVIFSQLNLILRLNSRPSAAASAAARDNDVIGSLHFTHSFFLTTDIGSHGTFAPQSIASAESEVIDISAKAEV